MPKESPSPDGSPTVPATVPATVPTCASQWTVPEGDAARHAVAVANERYELLAEIARGGMGVVYRARDRALDREVGVKTLRGMPLDGSTAVTRFRAEAHITAQLQHPNVPPVHDLGTLPDGRPFLAMKLVRGETLEALLRARPAPSHDPGRFLAIFEQIAHGVAYAHSLRVVHRDLKPLNVMVGAFGEVQVMDWGLAKALAGAGGSSAPGAAAPEVFAREPDGGSDDTRPGSVFGTPAYMPREQATGAVDRLDERSDVFSLGGILCAILTGRPPYVGGDVESTRQLAAVAMLGDCFARLDASGADPAVVALCKRCLAAERDDRPANAGAVAAAVAALRAEAERRARQAELDAVRADGDRARAELRAAEQKKRRRVQLALLAAVALLAGVGGAFAWWRDRQAHDRRLADEQAEADRRVIAAERDAEARSRAEQARQGAAGGLALAAALRKQSKFKEAAVALEQAARLAADGAPELTPTVARARDDLALVAALDDIRYRKWAMVAVPGGRARFPLETAAPKYRAAFAARGLDPDAGGEVAARIAASDVKDELVAALDDWALVEPESARRERILSVARAADPGAWSDRLRDPQTWLDRDAIRALAGRAEVHSATPATTVLLTGIMERAGIDPSPLLTAARARHPAHFELAFALGRWHGLHSKGGLQIGPYEAARALRPDNLAVWNNLGGVMRAQGDLAGSRAAHEAVVALAPEFAIGHYNLGVDRHDRGDFDGALAAYDRALALDPEDPKPHTNRANLLAARGDWEGARAAYDRAAALDPAAAFPHYNQGVELRRRGEADAALAAFRRATDRDARFAPAHSHVGDLLKARGDWDGAVAAYRRAVSSAPDNPKYPTDLGVALKERGDLAGALAAYERALELDPKVAIVHNNVGNVLRDQRDLSGAVAAYRRAIALDPKYAVAHFNLGEVLTVRKDVKGAIAAYEQAVAHNPKHVRALNGLGNAYHQAGNPARALDAYKRAAAADPGFALPHYNTGVVLAEGGDLGGAAAAYERAVALNPKDAQALVNLGNVRAGQRDWDAALAAYARAVQLEPNRPHAHSNMASIYAHQKQYAKAVESARAAVKADPTFVVGYVVLSGALEGSGDSAGAREALAEAARLDKKWLPALAKLPSLPVAPPPREVVRP